MTGEIFKAAEIPGTTRPRFWTAWNFSWKKKKRKSPSRSVEALAGYVMVENEELLQILLSTDKKTLQMIVLKDDGICTKRDQSSYGTAGADGLYKTARRLRKKDQKSP